MKPDERYCSFVREDGTRCGAFRVRKPEVDNPRGLCSGHLGLGLARAPREYAKLGAIARNRDRVATEADVVPEDVLEVLQKAVDTSAFTDPALEAKARQMLDRRTASALAARQAQVTAQAALEVAHTEAEKKAARREQFIRQQREIDPTFDLDEAIRRSHEIGREDAAFRVRQGEIERASASRFVERSAMPKRKRRRQHYVWKRYAAGGPGLEDYSPGAVGQPYDLW